MAATTYAPALGTRERGSLVAYRHSALVRVTHWISALSFIGLAISGRAILLAHPRLYWGETGAVGTPALIDLPFDFVLVGQSGWGRSLHFLSAWVAILTGLIYVAWGVVTDHIRRDLLPARADLAWRSIGRAASNHLRLRSALVGSTSYNPLQRLAYLAVVFVMFPLTIWTGLAMSPAMTSVFPTLVNVLGGQQSARTIHFFAACLLVLFLIVHVVMVWLTGFVDRMWAMIAGGSMEVDRL